MFNFTLSRLVYKLTSNVGGLLIMQLFLNFYRRLRFFTFETSIYFIDSIIFLLDCLFVVTCVGLIDRQFI